MKSSASSSAKATPDQPSTRHDPPRAAFALTGPSVRLDPTTHAVRGDLADVRLARQVFAPHYAAAMPCTALRALVVHDRAVDGAAVTELATGDLFEVLELAGDHAWGIAKAGGAGATGLVGYCDRHALALA